MEFLSEEVRQIQKVTSYMEAYDFKVYDVIGTIELFKKSLWVLYATVGAYLSAIYFGQKRMKNRPAFQLTLPLFFWNFGLALFSIIATSRAAPEIYYYLSQPEGTYSLFCVPHPHNFATSFWGLMVTFSKFAELGDTAFIVLRKQNLIPLHWFHHVATVVMCWFVFESQETLGRLIFFNTGVHSFMYLYYALKALKIKIPRRFSQAMTILQIIQLFWGMYAVFSVLYYLAEGRSCRLNSKTLGLIGIVIGAVLVLFLEFYKKSYFAKDDNIKKK